MSGYGPLIVGYKDAQQRGSVHRLPRKDVPLSDVPEGESTKHFRFLIPKTIQGMAFETRGLKYWVLGPSGRYNK